MIEHFQDAVLLILFPWNDMDSSSMLCCASFMLVIVIMNSVLEFLTLLLSALCHAIFASVMPTAVSDQELTANLGVASLVADK